MLPDKVADYKKKNLAWAVSFVALFGIAYAVSAKLPQGIITWVLSLPALAVIVVTAIARLDDIKPEQSEKRWQLRRIGLMLTAIGAVGAGLSPIFTGWSTVTWRGVLIFWGFALTWLTTPEMPPWWRFVTGEYRTKKVIKEVEIHVPKE